MRLALATLIASSACAQFYSGLSLPPSGANQKAAVTQFIGPVSVSIEYSSPAVKNRRGQIWGKLVPYGLTDLGYGHRKPAPWRAGANEGTVFSVSHAVTINGQPLPAGRYGLHMIVNPNEWTIIFSKNSTAWGSFFYEPSEDVLRVTAKPVKHEFREYLTYEFPVRKPSEVVAELQWEDLALPWTIAVPNLTEVYLSRLREELKTVPGFAWHGYVEAIQFCLEHKTNLNEALVWADTAISTPFVGEANFITLSAKAEVLKQLGRLTESKTVRNSALTHPTATVTQIHQYGRQLLAEKQPAEALQVFELNRQRYGSQWPVNAGLARGYAATGNKAKALEHAQLALPQAPDDLNRKALADLIASLQ